MKSTIFTRRGAAAPCALMFAVLVTTAPQAVAGPLTDKRADGQVTATARDVQAIPHPDISYPRELAQRREPITFDIPPGALNGAMLAFADAAGVKVFYDAKKIEDLRSPGVSGTLPPAQALDLLLAGTGVTFTFETDETVRLALPADGGTTLSPIKIEGKGVPEQAQLGKTPQPYAGGQVARGGRVGMLGNQDVFDTPFNLSSYTSDMMENQHAKDLADVVHNDSSAYLINAERSATQTIAIRGFNTGGNGGTLYDGLQGMSHRRFATVETLERVEIFKGANSLLTGAAGRIGGTVNLVPKRPLDHAMTELTAGYEPGARYSTQADVSRRFGPDDMYGIRINAFHQDGESVPDGNNDRLTEASVSFDYRLDRFRSNIAFDVSDRELYGGNQLFSGVTGVPDAPDTSAAVQQSWEVTENNFVRGLLRMEYDITEDWTVYGAAGATDFDGIFLRTTGSGLDSNGNFTMSAREQRDVETNLTGSTGIRGRFETASITHKLSVEAFRNLVESGRDRQDLATIDDVPTNIFDPVRRSTPNYTPLKGGVPTTSNAVIDSVAVADVLGFFDDRALLTLGVRHQRILSEGFSATTGAQTSIYDETALTPAVGLTVKPWKGLSLYGNYIESLEQGSTAPNTAANAGEVFPPAMTKQIELGAKYDFGDLGLTASLFQLERPSGITDAATNVYAIDGEQRHRGLELGAFGELMPGLRLLSGLTFIEAELTETANGTNDGNTAVGVPKLAGVLGLEWDVPSLRGLTLSFRANHTGKQYIDTTNTKEIPSYELYSLGARYVHELGERDLVFRANVSNLFDEDYWITFPGASNLLYYGVPRVVSFSASMKF
ncbi:MAG: TonB-dependent receptor [Rhodospirillales bacterium]|nr:TonB-dependent receptor [Rhodospirillales bacterium]